MKVSVCIITYNHEKYVAQAIDGVLMQEVGFDYEVVIGDDCSTDSTRSILLEYKNKFPDKIKLLLPAHNQGVIANLTATLDACVGDYIALCEGDDFWVDPLKLQKQTDLLDTHGNYSMVCTNRLIVNSDGKRMGEKVYSQDVYTINDVVNGFIPATQTLLFRNYKNLVDFFKSNSDIYSGDRFLTYYCSLFGDIYRLPELSAAYRDSGSGVWSSLTTFDKIIKHEQHLSDFHIKLGINITNPEFAFKSFETLLQLLLSGLKKPGLLFEVKYFQLVKSIWKQYRFFNRSKILRKIIIVKISKLFHRVMK
jgi:glycosyltransferase involved in cell wall biosynthesis